MHDEASAARDDRESGQGAWLPVPPGRWSWVPPLLLGTLLTFVILVIAGYLGSFGYGATMAAPLVLGCFLGYAIRTRKVIFGLMLVFVIACLIFMAMTLHVAGVLCTLVFGAIALVPMLVGALGGRLLHALVMARMRRRPPAALFSILFVIVLAVIYTESLYHPRGFEVVRTTRVLEKPLAMAWRTLLFYEEVPELPPLYARIGLPRPLAAHGGIERPGDLKLCTYEQGYLVKKITDVQVGRRLAFDIVEQHQIEDRSVELISGSFDLVPLDGERTRVTLTTIYRPLLQARIVWRPFEHRLAHVLHGHVLEGWQRAGAAGPGTTTWIAEQR